MTDFRYNDLTEIMGRGNTNNATDPEPEPDKKPQYGCQLAPSLPPGVSFTDVKTQKWTLGQLNSSLLSDSFSMNCSQAKQ